jgi:hypothetical protein
MDKKNVNTIKEPMQGKSRVQIPIVAALVITLVGCVSRAQQTPVAEIAAGYSDVEVIKGFTFRMKGGSGSVALNFNDWLGMVGDFGVYHAPPEVGLNATTYTFGPRFSYRNWGGLVPFAEVLAGGQHSSALSTGFTNTHNGAAFSAGAGADIELGRSGRFALRPQLDYLGFHGKPGTITTARLTLSMVFRLVKK